MSPRNEEMKTIPEDHKIDQNNNDHKTNISPTSLPPVNIETSPPIDIIPPRRLTCYFKTEDGNGEMIPDVSNNTEKVFLFQEEGKKSSFLLEPDKDNDLANPFYSVQKTPNIVIEHTNGTFFLGGLQLVSTAKSVEIYLTDKEGKETYLTTSKAITFNKEDTTAPWHKGMFLHRRILF